jgi:hypothetical protein
MNKATLYAGASPLALGTAPRNAGDANSVIPADGPVVVDWQALLQVIEEISRLERTTLQDWVNRRFAVLPVNKYLYRTGEAKAALGIGTQKLYGLINDGTLDARRFGRRTYITADSIEAFIASLPAVVTPTMAKAGRGVREFLKGGK